MTCEPVEYAVGNTPIGRVLVGETARGIRTVLLGDSIADLVSELQSRYPHAVSSDSLTCGVTAIVDLISAPASVHDLPLDPAGTPFQLEVWAALGEIPPGVVLTYGQLASNLGLASGARAVASACAANRIAVAVPCHRVVGRNGQLTGYRWGIERKRWLLETEQATCDRRAWLTSDPAASAATAPHPRRWALR